MVGKSSWAIALTLLLVAACNVSDDPPVVNKNNQNNTNQNNTNQNNTNQNNTNQNNTNNMTNVPLEPLPSSSAVTGGAAAMQSGNYSLKVSVGAPAANPKPKATQNQVEVAPVVPR